MASCDHLFADVGCLIDQVLVENDNLEAERASVYQAVLVLQRTWRGHVAREALSVLHAAATVIQRYVRGFLVRINMPFYILRYLEYCYDRFYNMMATRIQAAWRGYAARKIFNFHAWYMMKKRIKEKNEELRLMMLEAMKKLEEDKRRKCEEEAQKMVLYIVFKLHHNLRTHQRPGIYSLHGKQKYSKIEELIKSTKFTHYMGLLRQKYNKKVAVAKPLIKVALPETEAPQKVYNKNRFSFDPRYNPPCKIIHEKLLNTSEPYAPAITELERTTDWSKHISYTDFDITAKQVPPKSDVPPYYLDFWTRGCEIHDIPEEGC